MNKTMIATTLAASLLAGQALAAPPVANDSFRIESEDQFVRDYGDRVEKLAPGVYQVTRGALAGRTISLGESGLAFDLALLRAQVPGALAERRQLHKQIRLLQQTQQRYLLARSRTPSSGAAAKATRTGTFPCQYMPPGASVPVLYSGSATVTADVSLYLLRNDGFYNPYYARGIGRASGQILRPPGVPATISVLAYASAHERQLGQPVTRESFGIDNASVNSGYVYSGPTFYHNIIATASVHGRGDCYGYVSVSDSMTPNF
jgi:hypothetical protein